MESLQQSRPFVVIAGASRGIGAEYARALAVRGYDLLLVSRDKKRLEILATRLTQEHNAHVNIQELDLAQPRASHRLYESALQCCRPVDLLIHNAGFGMYGYFATMPLPRIQEMLHLHISTVVESTRLFLPTMVERQAGTIINVASLAGFIPIPFLAEYAATKAFLVSFSEGLAEEVGPSGVRIQACCPGFTETDFHTTAGYRSRSPFPGQSVTDVVQASLKGMDKDRTVVTVGWQGYLSAFISRHFPRSMLIRMAGKRTKPLASFSKEAT